MNPRPATTLPETLSDETRPPRRFAWADGRATLALVVAVTALRGLCLGTVCDYELFGDEALFWEWSRRLAPCYYEKGPAVAYIIAASTAVLGETELAVRLPWVLMGGLAALALARVATVVSGGDPRAGFFAAVLLLLAPAFQGNALIATPDGPLILCWILGAWAAVAVAARLEARRAAVGPWIALGAAVGLGTLCKQPMVLLAAGLLLYLIVRRGVMPWRAASLWLGMAAAALVWAVLVSPMIYWNMRHGWPTLAHTLGHAGLGGDREAPEHWTATWFVGLAAAQVFALGPTLMVLVWIAGRRALRGALPSAPWPAHVLMICLALPALAVYFDVALVKKPEVNWPFHAFATLLVPVAPLVIFELERHRQMVRAWLALPRPRPWMGKLRRRPETAVQVCWDWVVIYGVGAAVVIAVLPGLLDLAEARGAEVHNVRFRGHRAFAQQVEAIRRDVTASGGEAPLLIASHYMRAARLAFYLPDRPTVYCASRWFGGRPTSYDFWADTDLGRAELAGRPAVLVGGRREAWEASGRFVEINQPRPDLPIFVASGYAPQAQRGHRPGGGRPIR